MPKTSRKDEVIKLLKRQTGATTAQIKAKTGMQEHSARALISGIAKDVEVTRTKNGDKATVYSIVEVETKAKAA